MKTRISRLLLLGAALLFMLSFPISYWDWQDRWHTPMREGIYAFKLWLFWAQFCVWPLLLSALLGKWTHKHWITKTIKSGWIAGLALLLYAGQIEPNLLRIRHTNIALNTKDAQTAVTPLKIALISDIHWGLYGRDWHVQRLVNTLNTLDVDAVFVAGDWTYEPKLDLASGFAPFKQLKVPVLAVLGNHDVEQPGPKLAKELKAALIQNKVQVIEGQRTTFKGWEIVGLDDLWGGQPKAQITELLSHSAPARLVLTHQPDTLALIPAGQMNLGLAGHSHGGQVLLPYLTEWQLRKGMNTTWYNGLYDSAYGQVFVTPGLGMIGLPLRFRVMPTIDVLNIAPQK